MEQQMMQAQPVEKPQAQTSAQDPKAVETFRKLGLAAMKVIYDKTKSAQLVEMMKAGADNPPEVVAQAAVTVLSILQEGAKGIDPKLVYSVTPAVVFFLLEMAGAAKLFKPSPEIMQAAVQMVGEQVKGQAAPAEQQEPQAPQEPMGAPRGLIGGAMQPQPGAMPAGA